MTSIFITLLYVLHKIPLINILGDRGMGYYSIAFVIYLLFMTCTVYGIPKALSTILADQRKNRQYALIQHTVKTAFYYAIIISSILTIILLVGADFISTYILKASYGAYAIRAVSLCILPASIAGIIQGIFKGTKLNPISKRASNLKQLTITLFTITGAYTVTRLNINNPILVDTLSSMGASFGLFIAILSTCIYLSIHYKDYSKKLAYYTAKDSNQIEQTKQNTLKQICIVLIPYILTLIIFHLSNFMDDAVFNRIMSIQGHKENSYIILLGMLNGKCEFFISIPIMFVCWYMTLKTSEIKKIAEEGKKRKFYSMISQTVRYVMLFIIPFTAVYIMFSLPLLNIIFTGINDTPSLLLKVGAVSVIFYAMSIVSNTILHALGEWASIAKNALISLVVQLIALLILMIVFQWGIIAVAISRIVFSASIFILNEHTLRIRTGYVQEYKKACFVPSIAAIVMSSFGFFIYFIFGLFINQNIACFIALIIAIPVYIIALVFLGGITQREMYHLPGGKYLAPLCKKLHLIK